MKNLKNAYLRISVETKEQLQCAVTIPKADLIYIDSGWFAPEEWKNIVKSVHKGTGGMGKLAGLRLPQIFRERAEKYFTSHLSELKDAGFDCFLARNAEEVLWLMEIGINPSQLILDSTIYSFNSLTDEAIVKILRCDNCTLTWSEELNAHEICEMKNRAGDGLQDRELTVYGRTPLMVTAQCLRKTSIGCDRRMSLMYMKDRTGTVMPVKNCCTFCLNTIYNSVPTVLYDLEEIERISPDHIRYEFVNENERQMRQVLEGNRPEQFTRGHFKRGVL